MQRFSSVLKLLLNEQPIAPGRSCAVLTIQPIGDAGGHKVDTAACRLLTKRRNPLQPPFPTSGIENQAFVIKEVYGLAFNLLNRIRLVVQEPGLTGKH
jgi:hypothetical protein